MEGIKKALKKICLLVLGLFIGYFMIFLFLDYYLEKQYSINKIPSNLCFDAAVVFFGGFNDLGNPNEESIRRLSIAVDLYRKHTINNIIFAGGWRPSKKFSGSELMAKEAVKEGVKSNSIFVDSHSRDTIQNWNGAEKIIIQNRFKSILLISSPFHLLRIRYLIKSDNNIKINYATYVRKTVVPYKSFFENIIDFSYHVISFAIYYCMPSRLYQYVIEKIRK